MATISEALTAAVAHHQAGRLQAAEQIYRQILAVEPDQADAWHLLGVVAAHTGRPAMAVEHIRRAIALSGDQAVFHANLGNVLLDQGKLDEALACYGRALALNPNLAEVHHQRGLALAAQGKLDAAIACYRRAVEIRPGDAESHYTLGAALQKQEQVDAATACYRRALQLKPDYPEAHNNLGAVLKEQGKLDEAAACCRRAVELKPDFAEAYNNLGVVLNDQEKLDEAVACCRRAVELKPDDSEALNNLGNGLKDQGRLDEAVACYRRALELRPNYAGAHANLGLAWLLTGDWQRGWPEYEWRWRTKQLQPRPFAQPLWDGSSPAGKTILLYAEQGLGDTLQFVRYAPLVKSLGAMVIVECQRPLRPLLASCAGVDRLVAHGDELPAFDTHAPLLSLPGILRTALDSVPAAVPYLAAMPALVEAWGEKLRDLRGFKVGINWQGRPGAGSWRARNVPLRQFAALAAMEGVRLVSLQKGPGRGELAEVREHFPVFDPGEDVDQAAGAFMDSAAIMMHLDLVITSDTAVPHLAGALGVPVWVALPFAPDWRWMLDRPDSPWYPTMRLFRQRERGDWQGVFAEIEAALRRQLELSCS
jgi:tetratricopeptide (TPR) repeat protein